MRYLILFFLVCIVQKLAAQNNSSSQNNPASTNADSVKVILACNDKGVPGVIIIRGNGQKEFQTNEAFAKAAARKNEVSLSKESPSQNAKNKSVDVAGSAAMKPGGDSVRITRPPVLMQQ
jgi:hypothetical protein